MKQHNIPLVITLIISISIALFLSINLYKFQFNTQKTIDASYKSGNYEKAYANCLKLDREIGLDKTGYKKKCEIIDLKLIEETEWE